MKWECILGAIDKGTIDLKLSVIQNARVLFHRRSSNSGLRFPVRNCGTIRTTRYRLYLESTSLRCSEVPYNCIVENGIAKKLLNVWIIILYLMHSFIISYYYVHDSCISHGNTIFCLLLN